MEWKESRGESLFLRRVPAERLFSFFLQLDGSWQNRLTEEPQQSLEILCRCCQEELLAHELQSPQAQATQPDLVLQFRDKASTLFLCRWALANSGLFTNSRTRCRAVSCGMLSERKAALGREGARATLFDCLDIVEGTMAIHSTSWSARSKH